MTLNDSPTLFATVIEKTIQIDIGLYTRWIGSIEGSIGGVSASGWILWEQFKVEL